MDKPHPLELCNAFNDKGDREHASIVAFKVQGGQFVPIYTWKGGTDWTPFS